MSAQDYQVEELLERIRRLESSDAARRQAMPTEVIQAPRREAPNRADIQHSNFRADSVNTAGRDMYVVQLEERVRFLEGLDKAHRTRRVFFWLSGLCFIAAMAMAVFTISRVSNMVSDTATQTTALQAFKQYVTFIAIAAGIEVASIAFLILGLLARPPRTAA